MDLESFGRCSRFLDVVAEEKIVTRRHRSCEAPSRPLSVVADSGGGGSGMATPAEEKKRWSGEKKK